MLAHILALTLPGAALALREGRNGPGQPLTFNSDGTFQITIIEDLHYGEGKSPLPSLQNALTTSTIAHLLASEPSTDFVIMNGDLISRDNTFATNTTAYIDQALAPIAARGLTFASLHGNHDPGYNRSVEALLAREHLTPGSRTRSSVPDPQRVGATNYRLPIFPPDCPGNSTCGCAPELLLWFLDSRSGFAYQSLNPDGTRIQRPNWVDADVVEWFLAENARLMEKYNRTIPALVFTHIPVSAFRAIGTVPGLVDPVRNPGLNDQTIATQADGFCPDGSFNGTCAYGGQDVTLMRALANTPGLLGLFSAHIHGQSWCYKWTKGTPLLDFPVKPAGDGLNICFGQRTGYGGNGDWQRGARNLLLSREGIAKGELDTWIRLENDEVVGEVSLNATFGEDVYKPSPNRKTYCEECLLLGKPRSD
ncbi:Metallo-dependent phosphatase-like protein [Plectosphaerella cucumerina]|uniref:Metallo-dependent phosphatase-like protein n=1 Tax=Plectosphaerella cucumerina TaxID=40658 RepID=A0A8K0X9V8_9PEZI|nr:Metallo-dependent phosphatase-like protein [Plectosphaerella cucumerina]